MIGASSLAFDPARPRYEEWARLPWYDAPDFAPALAALVEEHGIARIRAPHPVVHAHLRALLCVDPWSAEGTRQSREDLDAVSDALDHEEAARIFRVNLLSLGTTRVNTLRMPSVEGAALYRSDPVAASGAVGTTRYAGSVALLHVDGNHERAQVAADVAAWMPMLRDGGRVVLDDDLWPFGDGPRRCGTARGR